MGFKIKQKSNDIETNNFINEIGVVRATNEGIIDFTYHNSSLIQTLPKFDQAVDLKYGKTQFAYTSYQYSTITDQVSLFYLGLPF